MLTRTQKRQIKYMTFVYGITLLLAFMINCSHKNGNDGDKGRDANAGAVNVVRNVGL